VVTGLRYLLEALGGVSKEAEPAEESVEAVANLQSFLFRRGEE
jgi:hypothetical protein